MMSLPASCAMFQVLRVNFWSEAKNVKSDVLHVLGCDTLDECRLRRQWFPVGPSDSSSSSSLTSRRENSARSALP